MTNVYIVECGISGATVGWHETYQGALELARTKHRFDIGYNVVWNSENVRVAQVWTDGRTWESKGV